MRMMAAFLLIMSISAHADHRGGNGGDPFEIFLKNTSYSLADFLESSVSKTIYSQTDINREAFRQKVKSSTWTIKTETLKDKFQNERCALNFPKEKKVFVNKECLKSLLDKPKEYYTLVLHEILNLMGLELPNEKGESVYTLSSRIAQIDLGLVNSQTKAVFSNNCNLVLRNESLEQNIVNKHYDRIQIRNLLKSKGYNFLGTNNYNLERDQYDFVLTMLYQIHQFEKKELRRLDSNTLYIGETPFSWRKKYKNPNSVVSTTVFYTGDSRARDIFSTWHPARIKIKNLGDQYSPHKFYYTEETILNSIMFLPSCILYEKQVTND